MRPLDAESERLVALVLTYWAIAPSRFLYVRLLQPSQNLRSYIPGSPTPFKISRTKIDLLLQVPQVLLCGSRLRCPPPRNRPVTRLRLNAAVDRLSQDMESV